MKASVLSASVVVFVAAAGICAASSEDAYPYKNTATPAVFLGPPGYNGDLTLLANAPSPKINREPRTFLSKFLSRSASASDAPMNPRLEILGPARKKPVILPVPEALQFNAQTTNLPSLQLLPPLPRNQGVPW